MTSLNHIDLPGQRCKCKGHPTECWNHPEGCGCDTLSDKTHAKDVLEKQENANALDRETAIAIAYFEAAHFQFWHQATSDEKEEALHVARAIIAADPCTIARLHCRKCGTSFSDRYDCDCHKDYGFIIDGLRAEVERLREAHEYIIGSLERHKDDETLQAIVEVSRQALAPQGGV